MKSRPFATTVGGKTWKWLPPPSRPILTLEEEAQNPRPESVVSIPPEKINQISVLPQTPLTAKEISQLLTVNGAENIIEKPCGNLAEAMIFATGRSSMHAKMLAKTIVEATKRRRLKMYNKNKPIEGDDDWILVDTGNYMIHLFGDEKKRKAIALEAHLDFLAKHRDRIKENPNFSLEELEAENEIAFLEKVANDQKEEATDPAKRSGIVFRRRPVE